MPNPRLAKNRQAMLRCHTAGGTLDTTMGFEKLAMQNVLASDKIQVRGAVGPCGRIHLPPTYTQHTVYNAREV